MGDRNAGELAYLYRHRSPISKVLQALRLLGMEVLPTRHDVCVSIRPVKAEPTPKRHGCKDHATYAHDSIDVQEGAWGYGRVQLKRAMTTVLPT